MSHFWPDSLIAGTRPFRALIPCCGDDEGVFLHLELSGMLRQPMEGNYQGEVPTMGLVSKK